MDCNEVQELLPVYIEASLASAEAASVRTHLSACPACRREEQLLSLTWNALGALPVLQPSATFRARFWERIRQEELGTKNWWAVFQPKQLVPVMAGFMVIWTLGVAGGLLYFNGRPSLSSPLGKAAVIFTSPLPPDSIEQIYLQGPSQNTKDVRRQNP